jgi:hypothetical protein
MYNIKISNCCQAPVRGFVGPHGTPDCDSLDLGICPKCGEHCEFINEGDIYGTTNVNEHVY